MDLDALPDLLSAAWASVGFTARTGPSYVSVPLPVHLSGHVVAVQFVADVHPSGPGAGDVSFPYAFVAVDPSSGRVRAFVDRVLVSPSSVPCGSFDVAGQTPLERADAAADLHVALCGVLDVDGALSSASWSAVADQVAVLDGPDVGGVYVAFLSWLERLAPPRP